MYGPLAKAVGAEWVALLAHDLSFRFLQRRASPRAAIANLPFHAAGRAAS